MERHLKRLTELICVWTPDGVLSSCNDAYCEFVGKPREHLVGTRWLDLLPPLHREPAVEFSHDLMAHPRPYQREQVMRHASGELRWLDWVSQPIFDASGVLRHVLSEGRDITARKQAEEAARESESRYRRLFEEATEGMVLVDAETGVVEDCNHAFQRLTGCTRAELVGRPLPLVEGEGPASDAQPAGLAGFAVQPGRLLPARLRARGGAVREVEIKGSTMELAGRRLVHAFVHDVTQERLAERYREASLVLLRLLNEEDQTRELLRQLTELLRVWTGCEAIGVRLREGDDYPFYETRGLAAEFVRTERSLCRYDANGHLVVDDGGTPRLDCLCGRVVQGGFDATLPNVSARGSFWTNALSTIDGSAHRMRPQCAAEGFESLALVPLRLGDAVLGVIQLADRAPGRFSEALVSFLENAGDQIAIALAQKAKLSSLEGGLQQIAALLAEIGVGPHEQRAPLPPGLRDALGSLSRRETEVLRLLLRNRRPATIAKELSRSVHTVRNQLKAIFRKLNVHSQEELLGRLGPNTDLVGRRAAADAGRTPRRRAR